jgi:hypothetical protein
MTAWRGGRLSRPLRPPRADGHPEGAPAGTQWGTSARARPKDLVSRARGRLSREGRPRVRSCRVRACREVELLFPEGAAEHGYATAGGGPEGWCRRPEILGSEAAAGEGTASAFFERGANSLARRGAAGADLN